jgi:hypothetical protein
MRLRKNLIFPREICLRRAYSACERNNRSQETNNVTRRQNMKTKLMMIGALAAACAVNELAAMPTAEETRRAEPVVKKLLASEREALRRAESRVPRSRSRR